MKLVEPEHVQQLLLNTQKTLIWRNENGVFTGPFVEIPARHSCEVAEATKKQLRQGRHKARKDGWS